MLNEIIRRIYESGEYAGIYACLLYTSDAADE